MELNEKLMGHRIRILREAHNLSRPAFAEQVDISAPTLKNHELLYREVSGTVLESIARHYSQGWMLYLLGMKPRPINKEA